MTLCRTDGHARDEHDNETCMHATMTTTAYAWGKTLSISIWPTQIWSLQMGRKTIIQLHKWPFKTSRKPFRRRTVNNFPCPAKGTQRGNELNIRHQVQCRLPKLRRRSLHESMARVMSCSCHIAKSEDEEFFGPNGRCKSGPHAKAEEDTT